MNAYWAEHFSTELQILLIIAPLSVKLASLVCVLTKDTTVFWLNLILTGSKSNLVNNDVNTQLFSSGSSKISNS